MRDRWGLHGAFGVKGKGKTKRFSYNSRFKSAQMVLNDFQEKIDHELRRGDCVSIPITEELKQKYLKRFR